MQADIFKIIAENKLSESKLPVIVKETYKEIFVEMHDEVCILFIAKNENGDYILGSLINEYDEIKSYAYFHTVTSLEYLQLFLNRKMSLIEVMKESLGIWVHLKNWTNNHESIYCIPLSNIPGDFLPLKDSYYPEFLENITL
jgi:hypothetical protein